MISWITSICAKFLPEFISGNLKRYLIIFAVISIFIISSVIFGKFYLLNKKYNSELEINKELNITNKKLENNINTLTRQRETLVNDLNESEQIINDILSELNKERMLAVEREASLINVQQDLANKLRELSEWEAKDDSEKDFAECLNVRLPDNIIRLLNGKTAS